jgi:hypothetical protein
MCSESIKFSLLILLLGVGIASVTDLKLNLLGSVLSGLAIATTCVGQIVSYSLNTTVNHSDSISCIFSALPIHAPYRAILAAKRILLLPAFILNPLNLNEAHQHNTEEVKGLFDAASVSIRALPSGDPVRNRPLRGSAPHQPQCLRPQIHGSSRGTLSLKANLAKFF